MAVPTHPSLASTSGALLLGGLVSYWLYGIQTLQAYLYFRRYPHDPQPLKWFVLFLMTVDTIHTAFTGHMLWHFIIGEQGAAGMRPQAWSFNSNTALTAIVAFSCQCFLARRVWILNQGTWQRVCAVATTIMALVPLASGIACTCIMVFIKDPALYAKCTTVIGVWLGSTVAVDVCLASLLTYTLYKSRTGVSQTDDLLSKLIAIVINTAMLTAGLALADLATFYTLGNYNLGHWAINFNISKTFINTTLASLNARRSRGVVSNDHELRLGSAGFSDTFDTSRSNNRVIFARNQDFEASNTFYETSLYDKARERTAVSIPVHVVVEQTKYTDGG